MNTWPVFRGVYILLAMLVFAGSLAGCGDDDYGAPEGSTITLDPSSFTFTAGSGGTANLNVKAIVKSKDGIPVPDVTIFLSITTAFSSVVNLLDGNAVPQGLQYYAQTDNNGVYEFIFRYNYDDDTDTGTAGDQPLVYFGDLVVSSGSSSGKMTFSIN